MPAPERKHPVHGVMHSESAPTIIFDTVCTKDRRPWLTCPEVHGLLREVWSSATAWLLGRYVIMPDHIHFFAGGTYLSTDYEAWVRYWKSQFSRRWQHTGCRWQTDHWDARIRTAAAFEEKAVYMLHNPVRKGLVDRAEDWPYQGEIHQLRWD
jgi:putative transposase